MGKELTLKQLLKQRTSKDHWRCSVVCKSQNENKVNLVLESFFEGVVLTKKQTEELEKLKFSIKIL